MKGQVKRAPFIFLCSFCFFHSVLGFFSSFLFSLLVRAFITTQKGKEEKGKGPKNPWLWDPGMTVVCCVLLCFSSFFKSSCCNGMVMKHDYRTNWNKHHTTHSSPICQSCFVSFLCCLLFNYNGKGMKRELNKRNNTRHDTNHDWRPKKWRVVCFFFLSFSFPLAHFMLSFLSSFLTTL